MHTAHLVATTRCQYQVVNLPKGVPFQGGVGVPSGKSTFPWGVYFLSCVPSQVVKLIEVYLPGGFNFPGSVLGISPPERTWDQG